jgi:hypothetical protein
MPMRDMPAGRPTQSPPREEFGQGQPDRIARPQLITDPPALKIRLTEQSQIIYEDPKIRDVPIIQLIQKNVQC